LWWEAAGDRWAHADVDGALAVAGLGDAVHRKVKTYSQGMRQRLGLARLLLGRPEVLVLDEPTNGLDPQEMRELRLLLHRLADAGATILISSHVLAEVEQIADDVVIIHRGRLVAQQSVADLRARTVGLTRARSPDAARLRDALASAGVEATVEGERLSTSAPPQRVGEVAAASGVVLHELTAESPSLEEAFLELTAGESGL
jgi:ABC-2 type transport system ATP-binding protein